MDWVGVEDAVMAEHNLVGLVRHAGGGDTGAGLTLSPQFVIHV
jgi:hypothetical protein